MHAFKLFLQWDDGSNMLLHISSSNQPKAKRNISRRLEILAYDFESSHDGEFFVLRLSIKPQKASSGEQYLNLFVRRCHKLELASTPKEEVYFYTLQFSIQSVDYKILIDKLNFVNRLLKYNFLFHIVHRISE